METVAIVGVGLIGSSFGLALREAGFHGTILGVSNPAALADAISVGAIHSSCDLEEACASADLIYLSQTVDRILETLRTMGPYVRPGALVTDAGSTKGSIVRQAAMSLPNVAFVGGHPLAGKEKRGAKAAEAKLFEGRPYVLTPLQGAGTPHLPIFRNYLERVGARLIDLTADEHDQAVAFTSHLPQLLSTALASTLDLQANKNFTKVYGPGLLDMTRLAMSSPDLWTAILANNKGHVLKALDAFTSQLAVLREALTSNEVGSVFASGETFAASLRTPGTSD